MTQLETLCLLMSDEQPRTLAGLARATGIGEATVSAALRRLSNRDGVLVFKRRTAHGFLYWISDAPPIPGQKPAQNLPSAPAERVTGGETCPQCSSVLRDRKRSNQRFCSGTSCKADFEREEKHWLASLPARLELLSRSPDLPDVLDGVKQIVHEAARFRR